MNRLPVLRLFAVLMMCLLLLSPAHSGGQDRHEPSKDAATLMSGKWRGIWLSLSEQSSGYVYAADLELKIDAGNGVEGKITRTLQKAAPDSFLADKIGKTAVEHVKGTYHPVSMTLSVDGYKKDDAHEIIALDKYRLTLADNNKVLGGITGNHETWQGLLSFSLKKKD